MVIAGEALIINFNNQPFSNFCDNRYDAHHNLQTLYPCSAVNFLKSHSEYNNLRLLNDFGWGGFLIWDYQGRQLFIDGRLPQAPFENRTILEAYWDFSIADKIGPSLEKYNIKLVLLKTVTSSVKLNWFEKYFLLINEDELNNQKNYLQAYLRGDPQWKIIYTDAISTIYVRQ